MFFPPPKARTSSPAPVSEIVAVETEPPTSSPMPPAPETSMPNPANLALLDLGDSEPTDSDGLSLIDPADLSILINPNPMNPINVVDTDFGTDLDVVNPVTLSDSSDMPRLEVVRAMSGSPPALVAAPTLEGTARKDFLVGTKGDDVILGHGGNDFIMALDGDDWVFGGGGNNVILGGAGNDTLIGGDGNDSLEGGLGNDVLYGGAGNDILLGTAGVNVLTGGPGRDTFRIGSIPGETLLEHPDLGTIADGFSFITDFGTGDLLDFSLVLRREVFQGLDRPAALADYITFQAVGPDTQVLIRTPQGQTTLEAMLLGVSPDQIPATALTFTPPTGLF